jgi:hypothetical protein
MTWPRFASPINFIGALAALLACQLAWCDDTAPLQTLVIGGASVSNNSSYSFAGLIEPIWGGHLGQGWFSTTTLSVVTYRYNAGNDDAAHPGTVSVHGTGPGLATGLGYSFSAPTYQIALSTQVGFRDIDLDPVLPPDAPHGTVLTTMPQLQARAYVTPDAYADLISNYTFGQHSDFNRLRVGWQGVPAWNGGLEGIAQHGPGYRIRQAGLFIGHDLAGGLNLGLDGGRMQQQGSANGEYIGVALSYVF